MVLERHVTRGKEWSLCPECATSAADGLSIFDTKYKDLCLLLLREMLRRQHPL